MMSATSSARHKVGRDTRALLGYYDLQAVRFILLGIFLQTLTFLTKEQTMGIVVELSWVPLVLSKKSCMTSIPIFLGTTIRESGLLLRGTYVHGQLTWQAYPATLLHSNKRNASRKICKVITKDGALISLSSFLSLNITLNWWRVFENNNFKHTQKALEWYSRPAGVIYWGVEVTCMVLFWILVMLAFGVENLCRKIRVWKFSWFG